MRLVAGIVAASVSVASVARAEDSRWGVVGSVGLLGFQPHVAGATFEGSGTSRATGQHEGFTHTGREIGATTPSEMGVELRLDYVERYFVLGLGAFVAGQVGGGEMATSPDAAAIADGSSVSSLGFAVHALARLPIAERVDLGLGPDAGLRVLSVPLPAFEKTTCHSKYGTYACDETATTTQAYLQPRLSITYTTDPAGHGSVFFVTGWLGVDIAAGVGMAGGIAIGVGTWPSPPHASP